MLRLRRKPLTRDEIKELDAFATYPADVVKTTKVGGSVSIITCLVIVCLIITEARYYLDSQIVFEYAVDTDFDATLTLNVDMTVHMPCHSLGADILDSTKQNQESFGSLNEEDTWFELPPVQRKQFETMSFMNSYLREEYHAVQELLWKNHHTMMYYDTSANARDAFERKTDACRLYGTFNLRKIAGNFHIAAGKSLQLARGHLHLSAFGSMGQYNFTHRINRFSFGTKHAGILHPLEGDEKITGESRQLYQYFIEVVPTSIHTFLYTIDTYQYSVKEHRRVIDHDTGSHGIPGIFFKYDFSALKIHVRQERDNFVTFFVRLFAVIRGIYTLTHGLDALVEWGVECFARSI